MIRRPASAGTAATRAARRCSIALVVAAAVAVLAVACTGPAPERLTLEGADYHRLAAWSADAVAAALPAVLKSCAAFLGQPDTAPLDPLAQAADFGRIADWRAPCRAAAAVPPGDDRAARHFFETGFVPRLAGNNGASDGLFTGYYEIELDGARRREGPYQTPIYRRPPQPSRYSRAEIDDGALAGQGLELVWVDDPIAAFFLQIQGSGRVRLRDGETLRLGYDGGNGRPYLAVGRLLVERGAIARAAMTMAAIRAWMIANPDAGAALRRENPSYVFFRAVAGDGPIGTEKTVLTAGRSLAVDRAFIPLGVPIWVEAEQRYTTGTVRRLVVAQDTGGAIKGPVRGDLFWGTGDAAGRIAGGMNAEGRYYLLLPRAVAARQVEAAD